MAATLARGGTDRDSVVNANQGADLDRDGDTAAKPDANSDPADGDPYARRGYGAQLSGDSGDLAWKRRHGNSAGLRFAVRPSRVHF